MGRILDELLKRAAEKGKKVEPGSLKGGKSEPSSKAKPGAGGRFAALKKELSKKGADQKLQKLAAAVRDPGALAAAIGRAKYGKKKFQEMAASGRKKKEGDSEKKSEVTGPIPPVALGFLHADELR